MASGASELLLWEIDKATGMINRVYDGVEVSSGQKKKRLLVKKFTLN